MLPKEYRGPRTPAQPWPLRACGGTPPLLAQGGIGKTMINDLDVLFSRFEVALSRKEKVVSGTPAGKPLKAKFKPNPFIISVSVSV